MARKVAERPCSAREIDPQVAADRAAREAARDSERARRRRIQDLSGAFAARARELGAHLFEPYVALLLEHPQACARPLESRRDRAVMYHRRCLALLRLGRDRDEAEEEAHLLEREDGGGLEGASVGARAVRVVSTFFEERDLKDPRVRRLVFEIAREAVGAAALPRTLSGARFVKDNLPTPARRHRIGVDFLLAATGGLGVYSWSSAERDAGWDAVESRLAAALAKWRDELARRAESTGGERPPFTPGT